MDEKFPRQAVIYPARLDDSNGAERCGLQMQATLALKHLFLHIIWAIINWKNIKLL